MKKILSVSIALVMMMMLALPSFAAATKEDIINEIKAGVTVDGKTKTIPSKYVDLAEQFFSANELTGDEMETALADLKDAKKIWSDSGALNFEDIPNSVQKQLVDKAAASAKKVGAKLTFNGTTIEIVDKSGKTYTVTASSTDYVKYTADVNYTWMVVLAVVVLMAMAAAVVMTRKFRLTKED